MITNHGSTSCIAVERDQVMPLTGVDKGYVLLLLLKIIIMCDFSGLGKKNNNNGLVDN